jgi:beta-galactosidase/beta-glucuronidase
MNYTKSYIKDYPRPSLVREPFLLLNGMWDFRFDEENKGLEKKWNSGFEKEHDIKVPFSYLTVESQVNIQKRVDVIWYQRNYTNHSILNHLLHFEGSDDYTMIWVNGIYIGDHLGGYDRFSFDITHALNYDNNVIVVRVEDDFRTDKPRGKQRWKPENFGCWYHETTGIWKSVWIEYVDTFYVKNVVFKANLDQRLLTVDYEVNQMKEELKIEIQVEFNHQIISLVSQKMQRKTDQLTFSISTDDDQFKIKTWSSDQPNLYDVKVIIKDSFKTYDQVLSYFGVTKWKSINKGIYLNDHPVYLKMLLDQGYWPQSGLTPLSEEDIIKDIILTKEMGFNGIRKHQKN